MAWSYHIVVAVVAALAVGPAASAVLLSLARIAAIVAPGPADLLCPGSTEADGKPVRPPVGYVVRVVLSAGADSSARRIYVSKACKFRYHGGGRGFEETGTWELLLRDGHWLIGRLLEGSIT